MKQQDNRQQGRQKQPKGDENRTRAQQTEGRGRMQGQTEQGKSQDSGHGSQQATHTRSRQGG